MQFKETNKARVPLPRSKACLLKGRCSDIQLSCFSLYMCFFGTSGTQVYACAMSFTKNYICCGIISGIKACVFCSISPSQYLRMQSGDRSVGMVSQKRYFNAAHRFYPSMRVHSNLASLESIARQALQQWLVSIRCNDDISRILAMPGTQRVSSAFPAPARGYDKDRRHIIGSRSRNNSFWLKNLKKVLGFFFFYVILFFLRCYCTLVCRL